MNFEEAYNKYKAGTATEEEKDFVEKEIEKAKKISMLMNDENDELSSEAVIVKSEIGEVLHAKKTYNRKTTIKTLIIVLCCMVVIAAAVLGGVFGVAVSSANKTIHATEAQAEQIAKEYVTTNFSEAGNIFVTEKDRDLSVRIPLKSSRYIYSFEVKTQNGKELEIVVDAKTGLAALDEIDD